MEEDVQQINVDKSSSSNTAHIIIDHPSQLISRSSSPPPPPPPPPAGGASSDPSSGSSSAQPTLISSFLTHQQHPQPHHLHAAAAAATSTISNPNPFLPLSSFSSRQISTFSLNPPPPPPLAQPTNSAPPPPLNAASSELADHPSPSAKRGKYVTILQAQWPLIPSLPISASASAAAAQLGGGAQSNIIINPNIPSASAGGGYNPNAPQLAVSPPSGPISSASAHSFSQSSSPSGSAVKTATMQGMSASSGGGGGGRGAQTSAVGSPSVSQSASQSTLRLPYASSSNPNNPPPSHAMGGEAGGSLQAKAADQPSSTTADGGGRSSVRKGKFVSPVWKPMEMLALAKAWRIQYSGGPAALSYSKAEASASSAGADQSSAAAAAAHKAKTRAEKDWEVAEYLKQQGVQRDMKTAATKWDNMLGDFRRVHEWEKGPEREEAAAGKSYFCLSSAERKQHRLPASFDEDVYEEMIQYVGHRPRSIGGGGHRGGGGRALVMGHNVGTNSGVITLSDYQNMGGSSGAMVAVYSSGGSNPHCRVKQNLTEGMFGSGGGVAHRALLIEAGEGIGGGGSLEQSPAAQEANNNNSIVNRVMAGGGGGGFMSSARMKRVGRVKMVWEESVQLWAEDTDTYYMNVNHPVATAITAATPTTITPPPPPQDHPMSHHLISSNHHSSHGMMSSTQDLYSNSMSNVSHKLNQEQGSHNNSGSSTLVRNMAAASSPPPPSVAAVAGRLKVESMSFLNADELVFLDESLTGNAIEVFEAGRLRGFSTHTFTPGQVIKVFGRRMNTTPPLPPLSTTPPSAPPSNLFSNISSPPPPLSSTHHHHHHLLSSTTAAAAAAAPPPQQIINSGVAILRDRTSYYLSCLKISASTQLPDLSELPFLFNEPPPRDLRFPVRTDVFMDLPPGRDAFFVASNDTDCRSIVYEVVAPLLRSVKLGVEKDFLIGLWDDCINRIVKVFCTEDIELIRNNDRNNSSSCEEERANMCGLVRKLCLWRGEERGFVSNNSVGSDDPAIRLVNKLLWTYGELPYILGYYAIGMKVTFCALSKGEGEQHEKLLCTDLATISLSNPAERFSCLVPCWRVAQLLPLLADACGRLRNVHSDYSRAHSGSSKVVEVMVSQVRKSYPSRRRWAAVKHVYELLAEQRVPCVERLVKHDEASLSLAFKPRGQPVRPGTVEALIQALKCVCTALVSVHSMSLMHRDVRWENVMKRGDIEDEWFLIDFEDAVFEEGSSASSSTSSQQQQQQYYYYPHRLAPADHAPEMCRGPHGLKVDVWGLGHLIRTCGLPHVPDHLKDLERRFTDPDPEQRPPIDDCFYLLMQVHSSLAHYNHHHHNQHHQ